MVRALLVYQSASSVRWGFPTLYKKGRWQVELNIYAFPMMQITLYPMNKITKYGTDLTSTIPDLECTTPAAEQDSRIENLRAAMVVQSISLRAKRSWLQAITVHEVRRFQSVCFATHLPESQPDAPWCQISEHPVH